MVTNGVWVVEDIVRDVDVRRTPAQLPRIGGKHEDVEPGLPCSIQERKRLRRICGQVVRCNLT